MDLSDRNRWEYFLVLMRRSNGLSVNISTTFHDFEGKKIAFHIQARVIRGVKESCGSSYLGGRTY